MYNADGSNSPYYSNRNEGVITMRRAYAEYQEPPIRAGMRTAASVMDFLGVMVCTVLILALMMLMTALYSWLQSDLTVTFAGIGQNINISENAQIDSNTNR